MAADTPGDAGGGPAPQPGPAPDRGLVARQLLRAAASASLATVGEGGQPHAALVTPAVAADGAVLLFLSTLSEHTRQLAQDPRCAVLVQGVPDGPNPQTAPRLSVTGLAERTEDPALKARWLARHPYAAPYAEFGDFGLWRIVPGGGLAVLGFGRALRLRAAALRPDPAVAAALTAAEDALLAPLNDGPGPAGAARALGGGAGDWRLAGLSADGCDLADTAGERVLFLPFPRACRTAEEAGDALRQALHLAVAK